MSATLPFLVLLAGAALPILFLVSRFVVSPEIDATALGQALAFSVSGAAVSALVGGTLGALAGTLEAPGRRAALAASVALIAAPPAFWWIGVTRLPAGLGTLHGPLGGSLVAGLALAPVTFMLVLAAAREVPTTSYESARVSLDPMRRVVFILIPLLRQGVIAGFLLTVILLLGESEIPFLFGFRTSMTDVVTAFSRTFDAAQTVPIIVPLVVAVLLLALLVVRPLFAVIMPPPSAGRGVLRKPVGIWASLAMLVLPFLVSLSVAGYASALTSDVRLAWGRLSANTSMVGVSIVEPVLCAWVALVLALATVYPARRTAAVRPMAIVGLLLFCIPAAIPAIGWIGLGQALGGIAIAPATAYVSRTIGLPALAFLVAYSRLPRSLEDAARLVPLSPTRRALSLVLPLAASSLAAATALTAALAFADRDVSSLLLAPGESRLMLDLYLLSANAPSAVVGGFAVAVLAAGAASVAIGASIPALLLLRRRG